MIPVTPGDLVLVLTAGVAAGVVMGLLVALPVYGVRIIRRPRPSTT
jgi:hypothetical protein